MAERGCSGMRYESSPQNNIKLLIKIKLNGSIGEGNGTPLQYACLEIPWTEEPVRLQSMGSLRVRHD